MLYVLNLQLHWYTCQNLFSVQGLLDFKKAISAVLQFKLIWKFPFLVALILLWKHSGYDPWEVRGWLVERPVWQQGSFPSEVFLPSANSQVGWFPSNYTQEEIDDPHTYCMAENVLDVMVKLHLGNHLQRGTISCFVLTNHCSFAGCTVCIQGPGRHWIELQQRRPSWGSTSRNERIRVSQFLSDPDIVTIMQVVQSGGQ